MPVVDRTHVRISRIGTALAGWIGDHHFGLGANVGVAFTQRDGVAVTLRHLAPIEPRNSRRLGKHMFWLNEWLFEERPKCDVGALEFFKRIQLFQIVSKSNLANASSYLALEFIQLFRRRWMVLADARHCGIE